jgi:hypothetical protein
VELGCEKPERRRKEIAVRRRLGHEPMRDGNPSGESQILAVILICRIEIRIRTRIGGEDSRNPAGIYQAILSGIP